MKNLIIVVVIIQIFLTPFVLNATEINLIKKISNGDKVAEYERYNKKIYTIMKMVDGIAYADSYSKLIEKVETNSTLEKIKDSLTALNFQSIKTKFSKEELKKLEVRDLDNEKAFNVFTFENKLKNSVAYAITNQYEKRAAKAVDDMGERFTIVEQGLALVNIVLPNLSKENTVELEAKKSSLEALVKKDRDYLKANISTGIYHDSHYNKMIFTSQPMKIGNENSAMEKKEFSSADNIYISIYLNEKYTTEVNTAWQEAEFYISMNIDGTDMKVGLPIDLTKEELNKSAFSLPLLPSPENNSQPHVSYWASKYLKDYAVGKHTITLTAKFRTKNIISNFVLNIEDKDAIKNRFEEFEIKRGDLFKIPGNQGTFAPPAVFADIKQIVEGNDEHLKVIKLISYNKDWSIEKDKYTNAIIKRYLEVGMIVKDPNGKCWFTTEEFHQDYAGGGKYGKTGRGDVLYKPQRVNCAAK